MKRNKAGVENNFYFGKGDDREDTDALKKKPMANLGRS
jgi:hypothetical protein